MQSSRKSMRGHRCKYSFLNSLGILVLQVRFYELVFLQIPGTCLHIQCELSTPCLFKGLLDNPQHIQTLV